MTRWPWAPRRSAPERGLRTASGPGLTRRGLLRAGGVAAAAWLAAGGPPGRRVDAAPVIDPAVRTEVARGPVRVLVELRVGDAAASGGPGTAALERAIAAAQQGVLGRLTGTCFTVVRLYATVPLLALEIGADALLALEGMDDLVSRVQPDRLRRPSG